MNPPTLTVIIPSFGREEALLQNVEDFLCQTLPPQEIIVVLQQPDSAKPSVRRLRELAKDPSHHLKLLEVTFANAQRARNLAITTSSTEFVLIMDDDLRIPSNLVENHLKTLSQSSDLDGVVGQVLEPGQQPTDVIPDRFHWPHLGWQHLPLNYSIKTPTLNWPSTNSCIRRKLAMQIGGFDAQFDRTWFDDSDFSHRLIKAGAKLLFDPKSTVTHLKIPSGGKRPSSSPMLILDESGWCTHFYFWRKNYGVWRARYPILWTLRYYIFRKALLLNPAWFLKNLAKLFHGWRLASRKLKQGPLYGQFK